MLGDFGDNRITLTACRPKFSAALRIIVAAELVTPTVESIAAPESYATTDAELIGEDFTEEELALEATQGDLTEDDENQAGAVGGTDSAPPANAAFTDEVSLDEGLNGDKDALVPGIIFGLIAIAAYFGFKELARRWKPWPSLIMGVAPVLFFMALAFERIDRFLPAG